MIKIVVIGGGPGGYVAAIRAAQLGAEVTLVERADIGGTCLNRGCIPTKSLLKTAELYREATEGAAFGVNASVNLDFGRAQARKKEVVGQLVGGVSALLRANKVKVISGTAAFTGKNTLAVDGEQLLFDRVIIASGSKPSMPPIPGIDSPQCIDSTGALSLDAVPERMAIIGGGVIGLEMTTIYASLGAKVSIIEMMDEILPAMDREMTAIVRKSLESRGIEIHIGATVRSIEDKGGYATIKATGAVGDVSIDAEKVLVSAGRRPNTDSLNLNAAGIRHEYGQILVDSRQQTNVPGIYAIGDCTGGFMLAHVASAHGEIAAENAMGHSAVFDTKTNPSCAYTDPEFAGVGLTEEEAQAQRLDYIVGRFPLVANGKSLIMGATGGMVKILAGKKYGEILGVHIVGPRATDLIAQAALAIGVEATLEEVIGTIYAHPTVAESVREAALAARGRAIHIQNR